MVSTLCGSGLQLHAYLKGLMLNSRRDGETLWLEGATRHHVTDKASEVWVAG